LTQEMVAVAWELAEDDGMRRSVARRVRQAATRNRTITVHAGEGVKPAGGTGTVREGTRSSRSGSSGADGRRRDAEPAEVRVRVVPALRAGVFTEYGKWRRRPRPRLPPRRLHYSTRGEKRRYGKENWAGECEEIKTLEYRAACQKTGPTGLPPDAWVCRGSSCGTTKVDNTTTRTTYRRRSAKVRRGRPVDSIPRPESGHRVPGYYEMMPLPDRWVAAKGPDMRLYRKASFGRLDELLRLATRQYRTDQPTGTGSSAERRGAEKPTNTLLGRKAARWLDRRLFASRRARGTCSRRGDDGDGPRMDRGGAARRGTRWTSGQGARVPRRWRGRFWPNRKVARTRCDHRRIRSNGVNDLRAMTARRRRPGGRRSRREEHHEAGGNGRRKVAGLDKAEGRRTRAAIHARHRGSSAVRFMADVWQSDYVVVADVDRSRALTALKQARSSSRRGGRKRGAKKKALADRISSFAVGGSRRARPGRYDVDNARPPRAARRRGGAERRGRGSRPRNGRVAQEHSSPGKRTNLDDVPDAVRSHALQGQAVPRKVGP